MSTDPYLVAPDPNDWIGRIPRTSLNVNNDAKLFLQHVEAIRVLWQVRVIDAD